MWQLSKITPLISRISELTLNNEKTHYSGYKIFENSNHCHSWSRGITHTCIYMTYTCIYNKIHTYRQTDNRLTMMILIYRIEWKTSYGNIKRNSVTRYPTH